MMMTVMQLWKFLKQFQFDQSSHCHKMPLPWGCSDVRMPAAIWVVKWENGRLGPLSQSLPQGSHVLGPPSAKWQWGPSKKYVMMIGGM